MKILVIQISGIMPAFLETGPYEAIPKYREMHNMYLLSLRRCAKIFCVV